MKQLTLTLLATISMSTLQAQYKTPAQKLITKEDSLHQGLTQQQTVISGYGSAFYQRDNNAQQATTTLERAVLFVGHQFNDRISFFSELEIENAKVEGGEGEGEVAMEQAFLKFNISPNKYIVAGLFVPRIGLLNENHLPVNFNGVERPLVESLVIPATWRELGVCLYGNSNRFPINYSLGLVNGLNQAKFAHENGIREGRAEGSMATANNLAILGSLQYFSGNFKYQISGYMGGTNGLAKNVADSLNLKSGAFAMPVFLGEANVQFNNNNGFAAKALATFISLTDANKINAVYGTNVSKSMYGTYGEVGYDLFHKKQKQAQLIAFARYEMLDLNAGTEDEDPNYDGTLKQSHLIAGFTYLPIPNVVIKADVRLMQTGEENPLLVQNPLPNGLSYKPNNSFINIGIGYSF